MASQFKPNPNFMPDAKRRFRLGLESAGTGLQNDLKKTLRKNRSPSRPGQAPGVVTGQLHLSVQQDRSNINQFVLRVGTNLAYGRHLEYGARIRPKNKKALAVPLTDLARKNKPNKFPKKLQMIKRKGRAPLLVQLVGGKKKRMIPHYILLGQVNLAPRPWMRPTLKTFQGRAAKLFKGAWKK